jgi:lysophospholipase L1-like esterase
MTRLILSLLIILLACCAATAQPVLYTREDSSRALALESPSLLAEPFPLHAQGLAADDGLTRLMLFAGGIDPSRGVTARAEDEAGTWHELRVEHVGHFLPLPWATVIVVRLAERMAPGDCLVEIEAEGVRSNRVRLAVGNVGTGPADPADPPQPAPAMTVVLAFDGNSLVAGYGVGEESSFAALATLDALQPPRAVYHNFSVSGQTTEQMNADAAREVDAKIDPTLGPNVLVVWEGTNDLYFGATADEAYEHLARYCRERRAAGWKVVLLTILPRGGPGTPADFEQRRQAVNARLRLNWPEFADGLADVAADPALGSLNAVYYLDGVHINNVGHIVVARYVIDWIKHVLRTAPSAGPAKAGTKSPA